MDPIIEFSELIIKIGVLFAKCDGVYDSREDDFIKSFSHKLIENQIINNDIEKRLKEIANEEHDFDEIVSSTKTFLAQFNDVEVERILKTIKEFIEKLIAADSVYAPEEISLYNRWIKEFGNNMPTLCEKCYNNNYRNCYEGKPQYMKVYNEDDCNAFLENEDCGPLDEDLGLGQDEP